MASTCQVTQTLQVKEVSTAKELLSWNGSSKEKRFEVKEASFESTERSCVPKRDLVDQQSDSEDSGINGNQSPVPAWDPVSIE
jgi:hypothetical protein